MFISSKPRRPLINRLTRLINGSGVDATVTDPACSYLEKPPEQTVSTPADLPQTQGVFISYRQRGDYRFMAASIHYFFQQHFGEDRVFFDISSMRPGARYPDELRRALARSKVLIAVIHRNWVADLRERQAGGNPDWVFFEVETALRTGMVVVPVLLDDARLPSPDELPEAIGDLANRHACVLQWWSLGDDLDRLVKSVELYLPPGDSRTGRRRTARMQHGGRQV